MLGSMDGWWGRLRLLGSRITMMKKNERRLLGWRRRWRRNLCLWFRSVERALGSWVISETRGFPAAHMPARKLLAWCPPRPSMLLLSNQCWQSMDHRQRETHGKKGGELSGSSSTQWIHRAKTCWFILFKGKPHHTLTHTHLIDHIQTHLRTLSLKLYSNHVPSPPFHFSALSPRPYFSAFSHIHAEVRGADEKQR